MIRALPRKRGRVHKTLAHASQGGAFCCWCWRRSRSSWSAEASRSSCGASGRWTRASPKTGPPACQRSLEEGDCAPPCFCFFSISFISHSTFSSTHSHCFCFIPLRVATWTGRTATTASRTAATRRSALRLSDCSAAIQIPVTRVIGWEWERYRLTRTLRQRPRPCCCCCLALSRPSGWVLSAECAINVVLTRVTRGLLLTPPLLRAQIHSAGQSKRFVFVLVWRLWALLWCKFHRCSVQSLWVILCLHLLCSYSIPFSLTAIVQSIGALKVACFIVLICGVA